MNSPPALMSLSTTGFSFFVVFQVSVLMALVSHFRSAFTNPGKTPKIMDLDESEDIRYCEVCDQVKPPRTHHCRKCNICIHRMDHHCIWINNCVGYKNHKYFLLFLFYVMLSSIISLLIIIYSGYLYLKNQGAFIHWKVFLVLVAGFESILFGIFTADFLKEQISILKENQSTIEKVLRKYGEDKGCWANLSCILGNNKLMWLFPVSPKLSVDFKEILYNYSQIIIERQKRMRLNSISPEYVLID